MHNKEFIKYLNTLHNAGAKNENAIAEANQKSEFFQDIMVKRPTTDFIVNALTKTNPHIILITGHAGDGKTGLLIQVLQELKAETGVLEPSGAVTLPGGDTCIYIKDFSELSASLRKEKLKDCLEQSRQGKFVILVANTGPLLNTFGELFRDEGEHVQMQLIDAIDTNNGEIKSIAGYELRVINVAGIDNSSFVEPFLLKLVSDKCFGKCSQCLKISSCPIHNNRRLICDNSNKVCEFLRNHLIWQQEHGKRLTIRQIIAQITFALTAGLECEDVKNAKSKKYLFNHLFSNSLFGYNGIKHDGQALQIQAVYDLNANGYDCKSFSSDEDIFILQDFSSFHSLVKEIILELKDNYINGMNVLDWQKAVRRMYMLFNIETDDFENCETVKSIFSKKFPRYLELRSGRAVNNDDKTLIMEAFSVLFVGHANKQNRKISITMKRENTMEQSVQMLYGTIDSRYVKLKTLSLSSCSFGEAEKREVFLEVFGKTIGYPISLPLLNYFEDIRSGIIWTNIDPQLTHGIDSIKAQILAACKSDTQSGLVEMLVMETAGYSNITMQEENNNWILI